MSPKKNTQKSATTATGKSTTRLVEKSGRFTAEEQAAMKERAKELKAEARANKDKAAGESAALAAIAAMKEPDRSMAKRLRAIIKAGGLSAKTWYGMPAYTGREGNVVCFFQSAQKFKTRCATLGFSDKADLDDSDMWPTSFAIMKLTPAVEAKIAALVKKAMGENA